MLETEDQPPSSVEVLITDADEIRRLNSEFRGIDRVTDVLSFPDGEGSLGEIAVCLPIAEEQAAERGISLESELGCLAVHGGLHLLGYDDDTEDGRRQMIDKMNAIVSRAGFETHDEWGSIYEDRT
jgi:probable rRNA maturation factor